MNKEQLKLKNKLVKILKDNNQNNCEKFVESLIVNNKQWINALTYLDNLVKKKEGN